MDSCSACLIVMDSMPGRLLGGAWTGCSSEILNLGLMAPGRDLGVAQQGIFCAAPPATVSLSCFAGVQMSFYQTI